MENNLHFYLAVYVGPQPDGWTAYMHNNLGIPGQLKDKSSS